MTDLSASDLALVRSMTKGAYDLQLLRIQAGLRLCANFRSKLGLQPGIADDADPEIDEDDIGDDEDEAKKRARKEKKEALKIIKRLRDSYSRLTEGIARNRQLPTLKGFKGDELISTYTELQLVHAYMQIVKDENAQFTQLGIALERIAIYREYLRDVIGVGPAMGAVLVSFFDPHKARHISSFWKYCGIDVAADGYARSRREEHLVERQYKAKDGTLKMRRSVTYNPWLRARLLGVLGVSFLRTEGCPWKKVYDDYKHRLETDGKRNRQTTDVYKKAFKQAKTGTEAEKKAVKDMWTPRRIHLAAVRYMIKMFLADLWLKWRALEGLELTPTYHEAILGHKHAAE